MRTASMIFILLVTFALPAQAGQCAPRGQCAMKWWKGPDCACHHHGKEIKPYPTGIDGGPPTR
jgi:hypothetical protein